jgi:cold shock CspA family protein
VETPVHIDFEGEGASPSFSPMIEDHVAQLEKRFGRVTSCRVALKAPSHHHRTGIFEVHIHLSLPNGREVKVSRTSQDDERYTNPKFAIGDAFKRARRQLQDHVRRLQGQVKRHEGSPVGTVTKLDQEKGFGFLEASDGREIYFHQNSVLNGAFGRLKLGTRVSFSEEIGEKGPQASTVKLLGKHGLL